MSDIFERLMASGLIGEIESFMDKREFIAEPGELLILNKDDCTPMHVMYFDFFVDYPPFSVKNFHALVYFNNILNGKYTGRPGDFNYYEGMKSSTYASSYLIITDKHLKKFNIERVGTASLELLKFFQDQPKIEKLTQIIET